MWSAAFFAIISLASAQTICYECYGNSTDSGKFCSIDKLCKGTSCYFDLNSDSTWSSGCSDTLAASSNITCSTDSSCSCNSDFCNSFKKVQAALESANSGNNGWFASRKNSSAIELTLPNRTMIYCEECGTVTVNGTTVDIPCDHDHTCQGNYCVSIRGSTPYSYCGGVWDEDKDPACYHVDDQPEKCICSMHMCNFLLEPAAKRTTVANPTLATTAPTLQSNPEEAVAEVTTEKATTKKKCKNGKYSPNDQAMFMGEKLKNVLFGGNDAGDLENEVNDHLCTED